MASRKSPPQQQPIRANLNVEQMRKGVARLERIIDEIESFDADKLSKRWSPEQNALETTIKGALTGSVAIRQQ